jgi:hypothetical protein
VFEGGGYGVAVTVAPLEPLPWPEAPLPPGVEAHPARLGELMPVDARSQPERAAELQRVTAAEGVLAAYKAEIIASMARHSTDAGDRRPGQAGAASPVWSGGPDDDPLPDASEFFPDELAMTLNCSRTGATTLAEVSVTLTERLRVTWAALADGELDWPRARAIAMELGWAARDVNPVVIREVEAAVLRTAMELSVKRLRAATRRELLSRDAAAADRRRKQAEKAFDVRVRALGDGLGELIALMPLPLALATAASVDGFARLAKADGDPRPIGALRSGALADFVLRPWDTSRPPVTADLTVVAPLPSLRKPAAPRDRTPAGEVNGEPITAAHLRELLEELDALCPGGLQAPDGGELTIAVTDPDDGSLRAALTRPELERLVRRGCPDHPGANCTCPVLGPPSPPPGNRYRPTPALYRFARARDRTCRHPGCTRPAGWADLDHVVPHGEGGATDCCNLCCLCRRHHRLKTFAEGWRFALSPDGVLSVTTPSGITRITRPPGWFPPGGPGLPPPDPPWWADDPPPF